MPKVYDEVLKINARDRWLEGLSARFIAETLVGCSIPTVYNWIKQWKKVTSPKIKTIDDIFYCNPKRVRSKYHRTIRGETIDVYDILSAFDVTNPALQHLIKKALMPGDRGHKTREDDLREVLASARRALELEGYTSGT